ncbi:hypothetical protein POM88_018728 [Heracleum sosnowskyi]|uniref:Uncharacterized protein n=1 Tax=Heracleum sosnowskyi TaxID=360622 RepID=A0AAD8IUY4_9APIA|nr:hypothetical protein POM88_018728 [Heracleum sosnowskyi]
MQATFVVSIIAFLAYIVKTAQNIVDSNLTLRGFYKNTRDGEECRFFQIRHLCEFLIPYVYLAIVYVGFKHLEATDNHHQNVKETMAILTYILTVAILVCGGYPAALDASEHIYTRLKVNGNDVLLPMEQVHYIPPKLNELIFRDNMVAELEQIHVDRSNMGPASNNRNRQPVIQQDSGVQPPFQHLYSCFSLNNPHHLLDLGIDRTCFSFPGSGGREISIRHFMIRLIMDVLMI